MNPTTQAEHLLNQLKWRYATKQFDPNRKISAHEWAALEHALVLAPSSFGLQPWRFVIVKDPAVRAQLLPASWGQKQIVDASHLVVFASRKELCEADVDVYLQRVSEVRGVPVEKLAEYRKVMVGAVVKGMDAPTRDAWAVFQAYLALGTLLTGAAILGIDACPMEGLDRAKYDDILGLSKIGYATAMAATLGYRAEADKYAAAPKVRFPREHVILEV